MEDNIPPSCQKPKSPWNSIPTNDFNEWIELSCDEADTDEFKLPIDLTKTELSHRLTSLVRQQYLNFLKKSIEKNYFLFCKDSNPLLTPLQIEECAQYLEQKALKSCMIVSLYRKAMLKVISNVREDTNIMKTIFEIITKSVKTCNCKHPNGIAKESSNNLNLQKKTMLVNAKTQTDSQFNETPKINLPIKTEIHANSLEAKIKHFEKRLNEEERKRRKISSFLAKQEYEITHLKRLKHSNSPISPTQPLTPIVVSSPIAIPKPETPLALTNPMNIPALETDDGIVKELTAMFGPEEDDFMDIFSEHTQNIPVVRTVNEIVITDLSQSAELAPNLNSNTTIVPSTTVSANSTKNLNRQKSISYKEDLNLKDSLWPCELHMQRKHLRNILNSKMDRGLRYMEKIRRKFIVIFGNDDDFDDIMGPYSPSIELDEILISSCKKRVAPMIVKYLMKPMQDGLISNRYLFKKLAKFISERIIYIDQYPDERTIEDAVTDYFCTHTSVKDIDDIY